MADRGTMRLGHSVSLSALMPQPWRGASFSQAGQGEIAEQRKCHFMLCKRERAGKVGAVVRGPHNHLARAGAKRAGDDQGAQDKEADKQTKEATR